MVRAIAYIAISLDWYIARPDSALGWLDKYTATGNGYKAIN